MGRDLTKLLSVRFSAEGNLDDLAGLDGTPFAGLSLALNSPTAPNSKFCPTPPASPIR